MAKQVVKGTPSERAEVQRRLRRKYPQMFKETAGIQAGRKGGLGLGQRLLKWATGRKKKKKPTTVRTKAITSRLKRAGLTDKEIARMRGKKR